MIKSFYENSFYRNLNFFKDRSKIGKTFSNLKLLINFLQKNKDNKFKLTFKKNIIDIYKKNFDNFNQNVFKKLYDK